MDFVGRIRSFQYERAPPKYGSTWPGLGNLNEKAAVVPQGGGNERVTDLLGGSCLPMFLLFIYIGKNRRKEQSAYLSRIRGD